MLQGKKVVILGDRDGVPGPAIEECVKTAGAEVVFSTTECFVWTSAGAMDLGNQKRVKELSEKHGAENVVVVLGGAEAEASGLAAETVTAGDPTFAGPLAGVQLGLRVHHIVDTEIKDEVDSEIYEEQVGMMEMVMPVEEISAEVGEYRTQFCKYL